MITSSNQNCSPKPQTARQIDGVGTIVRIAETSKTTLTESRPEMALASTRQIDKRPVFHFAVKTGDLTVFLKCFDDLCVAAVSQEGDQVVYSAVSKDQSGEYELTSFKNQTLEVEAAAIQASTNGEKSARVMRSRRTQMSQKKFIRWNGKESYEFLSLDEPCLNYLAVGSSDGKLILVRASESYSAHLMHAVDKDSLSLPETVRQHQEGYADGSAIELLL